MINNRLNTIPLLLNNNKVIISDKVKYCGLDDGNYGTFLIIRDIST